MFPKKIYPDSIALLGTTQHKKREADASLLFLVPVTGLDYLGFASYGAARSSPRRRRSFAPHSDCSIPAAQQQNRDTLKGIPVFGAGDRTRTGTPSLAADFESATSTISSHRHGVLFIYSALRECRCPVAVPEIFRSLFARKISTAAHRSGRLLRHRRRAPRSPDSHRYDITVGGF